MRYRDSELQRPQSRRHHRSLCDRERGSDPIVIIALLTLEINIPHAQSLKDKRMVVRSVKDRLRSKFNVAVAETDHQDVWQRAAISVTTVGSDEQYVRQALQLALGEAERIAPECVVQGNIEIV